MPRDVLALGRHIVAELQLEHSVDTLGRWLAHHVAELIARADEAEETAERAAANTEAVDTILKIWQHRATYENRLDPLAELQPALKVLRTLGQDHPPWPYLTGHRRSDASRRAYQALRRLTICLALLELEDREAARRTANRTRPIREHLSDEEKQIIAGIEMWMEVADAHEDPAPNQKRRRPSRTKQQEPSVDLLATARLWIEEAKSTLDEIERELGSCQAGGK